MESITNVFGAARSAVFGGSTQAQSGTEPEAGQTGTGTTEEPYDAGNTAGQSGATGEAAEPSSSTVEGDHGIPSKPVDTHESEIPPDTTGAASGQTTQSGTAATGNVATTEPTEPINESEPSELHSGSGDATGAFSGVAASSTTEPSDLQSSTGDATGTTTEPTDTSNKPSTSGENTTSDATDAPSEPKETAEESTDDSAGKVESKGDGKGVISGPIQPTSDTTAPIRVVDGDIVHSWPKNDGKAGESRGTTLGDSPNQPGPPPKDNPGSSEDKSKFSEDKSVLPEDKSVLPEDKSVLPEDNSGPSEDNSVPLENSAAQQASSSAGLTHETVSQEQGQGSERPLEEPSAEQVDAINDETKQHEAIQAGGTPAASTSGATQFTGTFANAGNFDASKPGAAAEARDLADEEDVGPKDTGSGEPAGLEDDASPAGSKKVGMRQKLKDRLHIGRNKD